MSELQEIEDRFWSRVDKQGDSGCWEYLPSRGRRNYGIFVISKRNCPAHRVAWALSVGPIPKGYVLDHVCHNPCCVNPAHLRVCLPYQNSCNRPKSSKNKSGFKGVFWSNQAQRWLAEISANKKQYHLGTFSTPEDAYAAYCEAASILHGEYAYI